MYDHVITMAYPCHIPDRPWKMTVFGRSGGGTWMYHAYTWVICVYMPVQGPPGGPPRGVPQGGTPVHHLIYGRFVIDGGSVFTSKIVDEKQGYPQLTVFVFFAKSVLFRSFLVLPRSTAGRRVLHRPFPSFSVFCWSSFSCKITVWSWPLYLCCPYRCFLVGGSPGGPRTPGGVIFDTTTVHG